MRRIAIAVAISISVLLLAGCEPSEKIDTVPEWAYGLWMADSADSASAPIWKWWNITENSVTTWMSGRLRRIDIADMSASNANGTTFHFVYVDDAPDIRATWNFTMTKDPYPQNDKRPGADILESSGSDVIMYRAYRVREIKPAPEGEMKEEM